MGGSLRNILVHIKETIILRHHLQNKSGYFFTRCIDHYVNEISVCFLYLRLSLLGLKKFPHFWH